MVAPQGFLVKFGISSWHLSGNESRAPSTQTDRQTERERMEHKWEAKEELKSSGMSVG